MMVLLLTCLESNHVVTPLVAGGHNQGKVSNRQTLLVIALCSLLSMSSLVAVLREQKVATVNI